MADSAAEAAAAAAALDDCCVYHEKQGKSWFNRMLAKAEDKTRRSFVLHTRTHTHTDSQLCGQHALNALLQGSIFTAPDLAEIGHALDEKERELMFAAGADTEDAIRFAAESSGYGRIRWKFFLGGPVMRASG